MFGSATFEAGAAPAVTSLPLIPAAMRAAKRWHVWKVIPNTDPTKKARKVPFYVSGIPRNGTLDAPADVAQLATRRGHAGNVDGEQAVLHLGEERDATAEGIG